MSLLPWVTSKTPNTPSDPQHEHRKVYRMLARLFSCCLGYLKFTGLHPRTFFGLGSAKAKSRWNSVWVCLTVILFLVNLLCCINRVWDTMTMDAPRLKKMEFFSLVSFIVGITLLVEALFSHVYMVVYSGQIFRLIDSTVRTVAGIMQAHQLIQICCFVLAVVIWTFFIMCDGIIRTNLISAALYKGTVFAFLNTANRILQATTAKA